MKIVLNGENALTLLPAGNTLTIESEDEEQSYSPFHMIGSGLASCTFSVLYSWAMHAGLDAGDLQLHVEWEFGDAPHRLTRMRLTIDWPGLPETRKLAAERAAMLCPVHATLTHPTRVDTILQTSRQPEFRS